jgi:hypothetical protein
VKSRIPSLTERGAFEWIQNRAARGSEELAAIAQAGDGHFGPQHNGGRSHRAALSCAMASHDREGKQALPAAFVHVYTNTAGERVLQLLLISLLSIGIQISYDSVGASAPYLRKTLGFSAEAIGDLYSAYHLPNIFMVILGGVLIDRIGAVNSSILFASIGAFGTAIVAGARTVSVMMIGRVILGIGGESLSAAQLSLLAHCFATTGPKPSPSPPTAAPPAIDESDDSIEHKADTPLMRGKEPSNSDGVARGSSLDLPAIPHAGEIAELPRPPSCTDTFPTTAVSFSLQLMVARLGTLGVFLVLPSVYRAAGYDGTWVVFAFTVFSVADAVIFMLLYRARRWDLSSIAMHPAAPPLLLKDKASGDELPRSPHAQDAKRRRMMRRKRRSERRGEMEAPIDVVGPAAEPVDVDGALDVDTIHQPPSEMPIAAHVHLGDDGLASEGDEAPPSEGGSAEVRRRMRRRATSYSGEKAPGAGAPEHEGTQRGICAEMCSAVCIDTARAIKHFRGKLALLAIFLVVYSAISVSFVDFATDMFSERWKYTDTEAGRTTSIITGVAILATVPLAYVLDMLQMPGLMLLFGALLVMPGHVLLLAVHSSPPEVACVMIGLGGSIVSATLWPSLTGVIKPSELGTSMGFLLAMQNAALCFAPMTVGVMRDRSGGYELVLGVFVALDLVCALLAVAVAVIDSDEAEAHRQALEAAAAPSSPTAKLPSGSKSFGGWDPADREELSKL